MSAHTQGDPIARSVQWRARLEGMRIMVSEFAGKLAEETRALNDEVAHRTEEERTDDQSGDR